MTEVKCIKVRCACYEVNGKSFNIPHACLDCKKIGLVLTYNHEKHQLEAICAPREDAKGRFIPGCNKISFGLAMTKEEFDRITSDPHTYDLFFVLKAL